MDAGYFTVPYRDLQLQNNCNASGREYAGKPKLRIYGELMIGQATFIEVIIVKARLTSVSHFEQTDGTSTTMAININNYDFLIHRDLIDPIYNPTTRGMLTKYGYKSAQFTPYSRNFRDKSLKEITYAYVPKVKDSIVFIDNDLLVVSPFQLGCSDDPASLSRISVKLAKSEILSSRFVWPN